MVKATIEPFAVPIDCLKNLGKKSAQRLAEVQINNSTDLSKIGSVKAFLKLDALSDYKPSLNFLYAMEAALQDIHWAKISKPDKMHLLQALDEARQLQKIFYDQTDPFILQTKQWLEKFVIHYNICPFAGNVFTQQRIDYQVINTSHLEEGLKKLIEYMIALKSRDDIETALLIFPNGLADFDDYLEFLAIAEQLIEDQHLGDDFQLASFHPVYCFEGEDQSDAANFTNRSPWPMLHIIRQSSIEAGLQFYQDPEQIPISNIKITRQLGAEFLAQLRERCLRLE